MLAAKPEVRNDIYHTPASRGTTNDSTCLSCSEVKHSQKKEQAAGPEWELHETVGNQEERQQQVRPKLVYKMSNRWCILTTILGSEPLVTDFSTGNQDRAQSLYVRVLMQGSKRCANTQCSARGLAACKELLWQAVLRQGLLHHGRRVSAVAE